MSPGDLAIGSHICCAVLVRVGLVAGGSHPALSKNCIQCLQPGALSTKSKGDALGLLGAVHLPEEVMMALGSEWCRASSALHDHCVQSPVSSTRGRATVVTHIPIGWWKIRL